MTPEEFLRQPYTRILTQEDEGVWFARILEFDGCCEMGDTPDEAARKLEEVAAEWIEVCQSQGLEIPDPVLDKSQLGLFSFHLPDNLYYRLIRLAYRSKMSNEAYLLKLIDENTKDVE